MIKYVLCGRYITSPNDWQRHYVSGHRLIELYGLDPRECLVYDPDNPMHAGIANKKGKDGLIWLYPKHNGQYDLVESMTAHIGESLRAAISGIGQPHSPEIYVKKVSEFLKGISSSATAYEVLNAEGVTVVHERRSVPSYRAKSTIIVRLSNGSQSKRVVKGKWRHRRMRVNALTQNMLSDTTIWVGLTIPALPPLVTMTAEGTVQAEKSVV